MKSDILKKAGDAIVKHTLPIQKRSPEILLVAGIVGIVGAAVLACKATRELDEVIEDVKIEVEVAHKVNEDEDIPEGARTEEALRKDIALAYGKGAMRIAKLYGPAVVLGSAAIVSILASHNILNKRNVAIAAAYSAIEAGFRDYRDNVIERFGEEVDKELKYGLSTEKITVTETDPETGKEKKVKKEIKVKHGVQGYSDYARFFDDASKYWKNDAYYNLMFLKGMQNTANDMLVSRGHLFLNEVYDMLGIPRTKAGQIVGWIWDPDRDNLGGDGYVDFGIYDIHRTENRDFVNGYEKCILLDFNVDGNIWELI